MIDCVAAAVGHEVGVGTEGECRVGVAEPLADGLDGFAAVEQDARIEVTQRVAAVFTGEQCLKPVDDRGGVVPSR